MLFLGIFGAVCFVLSLCEYFPEKDKNTEYITVSSSAELEYKVRNALLRHSGDIVIIAEEKAQQSDEFEKISAILCKENSRIKLKRKE